MENPTSKTTDPIVMGASQLAIRGDGWVVVMSDTLASYGRLARFKNLQRMHNVTKHCLIGAGGEYSDYQELLRLAEDKIREESSLEDDDTRTSKEIFNWLTRLMVEKRNKMDPYYNQVIVAGVDGKDTFLGFVDARGTHFEETIIGTGFGQYIAVPLLRKMIGDSQPTLQEAIKYITKAMEILYYRHCNTINKVQMAIITSKGVQISKPYKLETDWSVGKFYQGASFN